MHPVGTPKGVFIRFALILLYLKPRLVHERILSTLASQCLFGTLEYLVNCKCKCSLDRRIRANLIDITLSISSFQNRARRYWRGRMAGLVGFQAGLENGH